MATPTVSVILPVYNYASYVGRAIESVRNQTFQDFELVVVDDGSTDNSAEVAASFGAAVVRQENRGLAGARNTGVRASNQFTPYVALIDADDLWRPEKLAKQVALMEARPDIGLCHTNGLIRYEGGVERDFVPRRLRNPYAPVADHILPGNKIFASSVMLRRSALEQAGPFYEGIRIAEDWDMWFRMAALCRFGFIPDVLIDYLVHADNLSKKGKAFWEARIEVLERRVPSVLDAILANIPPKRRVGARRMFRRALALSYSGLAKHHAMEGKLDEARRQHLRAIAESPDILRLYTRLLRTALPLDMQRRLNR